MNFEHTRNFYLENRRYATESLKNFRYDDHAINKN